MSGNIFLLLKANVTTDLRSSDEVYILSIGSGVRDFRVVAGT